MADSLAMPREDETNIGFESTYPYLLDHSLRQQVPTSNAMVIERGMRRRTIEYVLDEWYELVGLRQPDVVIVHVGIVDCAPRVFLRRERQYIERLRPVGLRDFVLRFVHRHRRAIVNFRRRVYVPPERFTALVQQVIEKAQTSKVRLLIFINIITPPAHLEDRSPGFGENVKLYNQILKSQAKGEGVAFLDLDMMVKEAGGSEKLTTDGIHINEAGHQLLAKELERHIKNLIQQDQPDKVKLKSAEPVGGIR